MAVRCRALSTAAPTAPAPLARRCRRCRACMCGEEWATPKRWCGMERSKRAVEGRGGGEVREVGREVGQHRRVWEGGNQMRQYEKGR